MPFLKNTAYRRDVRRLIDANLNRCTEGARVVEDISRFILDAPGLTRQWKRVRHDVRDALSQARECDRRLLCAQRDIRSDVGTESTPRELQRRSIHDILLANMQRTKESLRALEEFVKLYDVPAATRLKSIRYRVYALEKSTLENMSPACHNTTADKKKTRRERIFKRDI